MSKRNRRTGKCKDCGAAISSDAVRCVSCKGKASRSPLNLCKDCSKVITSRAVRCNCCRGKTRRGLLRLCKDCGTAIKRASMCCRPCADKARRNLGGKRVRKRRTRKCMDCGVAIACPAMRCMSCYGKTNRKQPNLCKDCGAPIKRHSVRCRSCTDKAKRKHWPKGTGKCKDCGTAICLNAIRCRPCARKPRHGENAPNWRGGISFEPYGPEFNDALKRAIRERDGYTCAMCSIHENGRALAVHHIDYDKMNNEPDNLIALCGSCHSKTTNGNRDHWQEWLTGIMREECILSDIGDGVIVLNSQTGHSAGGQWREDIILQLNLVPA